MCCATGGVADDNAVTKAWGAVAARHDILHYSCDRPPPPGVVDELQPPPPNSSSCKAKA
jgi:hypothetical protein